MYRGKGNSNGKPFFTCGANNAVFVAMDKIVKKCDVSTTSEQSSGPPITQQPRNQAAHATAPATRSQATPATRGQTSKSVDEYTMQIQKNNAARFEKESVNATSSEKRLAAEFGMTIEEYLRQQKNYVDTAKEMEHKQLPPDPKIGDEYEEIFTTGARMMRGDGELTETIQVIQYATQHVQRQHHHEQHHDDYDYQVIEGGIVESNYVQISPYTSSSEQDNERRGYESRSPNLPVMAEGMRVSHQSKPPPRDQHYMKERGDGASLPSHLNDGSHDHPPNHSPHSSHRRPSPTPPRDTHPPADPLPVYPLSSTDPHHQFTIGSMVCVDMQKGQPLYGVIKWMGTVTDFPGTIAGVELVST